MQKHFLNKSCQTKKLVEWGSPIMRFLITTSLTQLHRHHTTIQNLDESTAMRSGAVSPGVVQYSILLINSCPL